MSIISLKTIVKPCVVGVFMDLLVWTGCSGDGGRPGSVPEPEKMALQKFYSERLKPLQSEHATRVPNDAQDFHDFLSRLMESVSRYAISQNDILEIMGDPVCRNPGAYEFEYRYPGYTVEKNGCILVWFNHNYTVKYCFSTTRPKEKLVTDEVKRQLQARFHELLPLTGGKLGMNSTEVERRVKQMKNEFKSSIKSATFTYQDVVDVLGPPTGTGKTYQNRGCFGGSDHSWTIEYRFPLEDKAYSVLCFVFYEALDGCLGVVDTSWEPVEKCNDEN